MRSSAFSVYDEYFLALISRVKTCNGSFASTISLNLEPLSSLLVLSFFPRRVEDILLESEPPVPSPNVRLERT